MYKFLDRQFSFKREFVRKEFIDISLVDEIYLNFHYTSVVCNNCGTVIKQENFGVLFYESVNCSFTLYQLYLEIFMGVLFNSLNRKILAIFIRGYYDKSQRRLNYETFKEKSTSNHLKTSSELVYNCVGYISLNPDYISFERVFMSYKKVSTIPQQI